jgi:TIR domain/Super-infection exclusion protein B
MSIFISYSEKDVAAYSSLCFALESERLEYWNTRTMKAGVSLKDQLREAINKCDVCIFIATRSSVNSKWCLAETGAFWGAGKRIILYVADPDIDKDEMPPLFEGDLWICNVRDVINQTKGAIAEVARTRQAIAEQNQSSHESTLKNESNLKKRFENFTEAEKEILRFYIRNGTRTQKLQYDDGVVTGLIQEGILHYASNRAVSYWDPPHFYTDVNMELWVWEYIKEHPGILGEDKDESEPSSVPNEA